MGEVRIFGAGDYSMRVWLIQPPPHLTTSRRCDPRTEPAGRRPDRRPRVEPRSSRLRSAPWAACRTKTVPRHRIKTGEDGQIVRLGDVARIELGAQDYALRGLLNNQNAVALPIAQAPGSNALELSRSVRATMEDLKKDFPEGVEYTIIYDTTEFVQQSIEAAHAAPGDPARGVGGHPFPETACRLFRWWRCR
jgi:multidrug efflux pump